MPKEHVQNDRVEKKNNRDRVDKNIMSRCVSVVHMGVNSSTRQGYWMIV